MLGLGKQGVPQVSTAVLFTKATLPLFEAKERRPLMSGAGRSRLPLFPLVSSMSRYFPDCRAPESGVVRQVFPVAEAY